MPVWVGESVVLRLGRVPTWSSLRHPGACGNTPPGTLTETCSTAVSPCKTQANSTAHSRLGVTRLQGSQIGSRDGEIEHKRQSGHLFDAALSAHHLTR